MKIYEKIEIKNFRCFKDTKIDRLSDFNIFVGKNASGKTSMLEAIFVHSGMYNPDLTLRVNSFRGIDFFRLDVFKSDEIPWKFIFSNLELENKIEIKTKGLNGECKTEFSTLNLAEKIDLINKNRAYFQNFQIYSPEKTHILKMISVINKEKKENYLILTPNGLNTYQIPYPPSFKTTIITSRLVLNYQQIADNFSQVQTNRKLLDLLIDVLRIFEPNLQDLRISMYGGTVPLIYAYLTTIKEPIPINYVSEGLSRALELFLTIMNTNEGVVLIDEIENGIHHSLLQKYMIFILNLIEKFNIQIFATTHSYEAIQAAYLAATNENKNENVKIYRFEKEESNISIIEYTSDEISTALDMELEIR